MFSGSIVAMVTPFKDGKVDEKKVEELVAFHLENGTDALVPCGCTGEAATLSHEEQKHLMEVVVKLVAGKIPVIPGTGSNNTAEAVELTKHAAKIKADGALVITPYYNKPTPPGLIAHYKALAHAADIPIMLYNVPSRTGVNMMPETVAELAKEKNIVAIKEASGSVDQASAIRNLCDITLLSGDDSLTLPILAVGAVGVVSVAADVIPRQIHDLVAAFRSGDVKRAQQLHNYCFPMFKALFYETNPLPVKAALKMMGMINGELRLPLVPITEPNRKRLEDVLKKYELVK